MYRLPKNFDGNRLVGHCLEQICFNENQVCLHFDGMLSIVVESKLSYRDTPKSIDQVIEIPVRHSDLMLLLGQSILNCYGDDDGTLSMEFGNGSTLKCLDTSNQYESYRIINGNEDIIV